MEGECPHEPPSAHSAEEKRCRDPRTARLLSPQIVRVRFCGRRVRRSGSPQISVPLR